MNQDAKCGEMLASIRLRHSFILVQAIREKLAEINQPAALPDLENAVRRVHAAAHAGDAYLLDLLQDVLADLHALILDMADMRNDTRRWLVEFVELIELNGKLAVIGGAPPPPSLH